MAKDLNDSGDILKTLTFLHSNGSTFEVCCIGPHKRKLDIWGGEYAGGKKPIVAGWFTDHSIAANTISKLDQLAEAEGIYITLNPCNPALVARADSRLKPGIGRTQDTDIEHLQNLLIDVDPKRPAGISATEEEKGAAFSVIRSIRGDLENRGWPEPLEGDSGNGGHLIYKIDLTNSAENVQLLKSVLVALDQKYSTDTVQIDTTVFNPARICKVYGTKVRKGDSTTDRPHRRAKILYIPDAPTPVAVDLLKTFSAESVKHSPFYGNTDCNSSTENLDVAKYLKCYGIKIVKTKPCGNSTLYVLENCLFDLNHGKGEAAIGQTNDGKLFYQCFHNSCQQRTWHDARKAISGDEPLFGNQEFKCRRIVSKNEGADDGDGSQWDWVREVIPRTSFPWQVLPPPIAESLQQLARSQATSPTALPGVAMAIFASLLGATLYVSAKQSWHEPLIVWFCDIRPSGSGKTPAARSLCPVLYAAQRQADQKYKDLIEEWQNKNPKDQGPLPARAKSYFITDLTLEGLRTEISGHGGTVIVLDELSAFISGQNQYKSKGSDRESWLCLWDGKPFRVVRAGQAFTVSGARVNIFGGIQPRVWQTIFGSKKGLYLHDGTVYRFLPTFEADQTYRLNAESWDDGNRQIWEQTLKFALQWSDEIIKSDNWKARELLLDQQSQEYFFNWRNELYNQKPYFPSQLKGFIPKITSYALRLSGILHCMGQFASARVPETILTPADMQKGIDTAMFYLGHIVDATYALCSRSEFEPDEMSDKLRQLARTLENLRSEVHSGRLAVGRIQEEYNSELPQEQRIKTARSMGNLLRELGLNIPAKRFRVKDKSGLSCLVWDEKTENFLKRSQHRQHSQQRTADPGLAMLQKENQHHQRQHDVDIVANEGSPSTQTKPCQPTVVANVDVVDVDLCENEKWEIGTI